MNVDLASLVRTMRSLGSDTSGVEAKRAAGGLPEDISTTLCAFANRPGGGVILLGIDESRDFQSVPINAPLLSHQVADLVRQTLDPPPQVEIDVLAFEGSDVVIVAVSELVAGSKPCRVRNGRHQGVWIRAFDGDYRASQVDEQALYSTRVAPTQDRAALDGATISDLDSAMVEQFLRTRRSAAQSTSRVRTLTDTELLRGSGVLVEGVPTVAAVLILGTTPQRLLPGVHVRAVHRSDDTAVRALDAPRIEGSVPEMIEATVDWVAQRGATAIRDLGDGRVINESEWPADAVRELIGNALLHRDLSWSLNEPVLVTLRSRELTIRNPGGLYGIRVEQLGTRGITPARNANMIAIASHVTLPGGQRTVEQLASGIPTILRSFEQRRYPAPLFVDDAVRFTAICRSALPLVRSYGRLTLAVLDTFEANTLSVEDLVSILSRSEQMVRRDLRQLVEDGMVLPVGKRGRQTLYRRSNI